MSRPPVSRIPTGCLVTRNYQSSSAVTIPDNRLKACPPCRTPYCSFLFLVYNLLAVPHAASLVSFTGRRVARRSPYRLLLSLGDVLPSRCSLRRLFHSLVDVLPAAPLANSLVSFPRRRLACRGAHCIVCFFSSTAYPPRRSLNRLFLSLVDGMPA
jgi:hypothetical protein